MNQMTYKKNQMTYKTYIANKIYRWFWTVVGCIMLICVLVGEWPLALLIFAVAVILFWLGISTDAIDDLDLPNNIPDEKHMLMRNTYYIDPCNNTVYVKMPVSNWVQTNYSCQSMEDFIEIKVNYKYNSGINNTFHV